MTYNFRMLRCFFFFSIFLYFFPQLEARSIIVPKKKTAIKYFLTLTNLQNKETKIFESDTPEFDLSEELEGEFSLEISFEDKWGRKIQTPDQKTIAFTNKLKVVPGPVEVSDNKSTKNNIVLIPYLAFLSVSSTIKDQLTTKKSANVVTNAKGVKISFRYFQQEKLLFDLDHLQGNDQEKYFTNSELFLTYDVFKFSAWNLPLSIAPGIGYAVSQTNIPFTEQVNTLITKSNAASGFGILRTSLEKFLDEFKFLSNLQMGSNLYIFRYGISQSVSYRLRPDMDLGLWGEFTKFANGNNKGLINSDISKIGINLDLSL